MKWRFTNKRPGDTERNPLASEYFDEEAIERPAQALVREAIQNSLDAAVQDTVRVRFFVSGRRAALSADRARFWFGDAWQHFRADGSGLRRDRLPADTDACPFVVVEDFGTKGLEGDERSWESAAENHFYAFFRAEGVTENTGGRGKWGVGKTVFPRSSGINTMLGLTVRDSDRRALLMGRAILRYHKVDGRTFVPDGYLGEPGPHDLICPLSDDATLREFARDFRLTRNDKPGLSVVVPYAHEDISVEAILSAISREYYYPILTGRLTVQIDGPDTVAEGVILDQQNLLDAVDDPQGLDDGLLEKVQFAMWANTLPISHYTTLPAIVDRQAPKWSSISISDDEFAALATRFRSGEQLAFRIPIKTPTANAEWKDSHFDVFLQQDLNGRGYPPDFIRRSIIIPDVAQRRRRGYNLIALVLIDDAPLATLLADAETPAHTHWSHQTQNFRDRYQHGKAFIDFVRHAPRQLAELLSGVRAERDRLALADFFPRPPEDFGLQIAAAQTSASSYRRDIAPGAKPPAPRPKAIRIAKLEGGFQIKRDDHSTPLPERLEITVAYDRSRGNPLTKYHPADFQVDQLTRNLSGADTVHCAANQLIVDLRDEDFLIEVCGFDPNRDVYVRVRPRERDDD
ncbi:MAG: hypothetical protein KDA32_06945 [Phycisphaerales bacterium]|nr:hypothetical protein [Phycisphaerales bacterium]